MSEQFVTTTKHFRKLLAAGYLLIVLLVGGIICTWLGEWRDLELLERENREINRFRKEGLSMRKAIEAVLLERGQGEFIP